MGSYNLNKEIDDYLDAMTVALAGMDFRAFDDTIVFFRCDPLIAHGWTKRILTLIDDCESSDIVGKAFGVLCPSVSKLRNMAMTDCWMAKCAGVPRADRERIFVWYSKAMLGICLKDPYALEGTNLIHTPEEIDQFLSGSHPATPDIARRLGRLISACYHFGHAAYSDMNPETVYDNYGSYDVAGTLPYPPFRREGTYIVVVKEFNNLRPVELWPETASLPCESIRIVCLYEDVKMSIDNITHVTYDGDIINGLRQYRLMVDGHDAKIEEVSKLTDAIATMAIQVFQKFQSLDFEKRKETYFYQKAYVYKRIYDRLGQDWRPSEEILAEARGKPLCQVILPKEKKEELAWFRRMADPRVDIVI
ncbi:MAG: hypothetical protein AAB932_03740 [Patescibacteria group bacterium]